MNKQLLENQIREIQAQYLDLLKNVTPMLEDENCVVVALDSISLFWRKKKPVIDMYLQYIVKERNAVFYTAAAYFDVENGEQYPFMLMGNLHIFDDPLGKYCEICHRWSDAPKAFSEKVSVCAKDNIDILEKCEDLVTVLPLRSMGTRNEEEAIATIGRKAFLEFFEGIADMDLYFKTCNTTDDIIDRFKNEYMDTVCLYEDDNTRDDFRIRVEQAIEITKATMGEGYSQGEYFYFSLFGSIQQAIDILFVVSTYNAIPLIRYPVALHNAFLLLPNFFKENLEAVTAKMYVLNFLYRMFDQTLYADTSLSEFHERVRKFSFETKALSCYHDNNPKQTFEELHSLIESFTKYRW